ncbi:MAG: MarR family winged helix-turn-helix transcriptional regulator [Prevotellaceae bacterium]|jgi:DNA-binding MarR family transcriptional regulator|nr:MarR family winged helix-turn-helix transcriptional regulator [Prevotellaceae bacterium]
MIDKLNLKNKHQSPFVFDDINDNTGFLFWQVSHTWAAAQDKMLKRLFGISQLQYVILSSTHWLDIHGFEVTQSYLSTHTRVEKMTIFKNVCTLQEAGLLERTPHITDARSNLIRLSETGSELLRNAIKEVENMDINFFGMLKRQRKTMNAFLLQIITGSNSVFL